MRARGHQLGSSTSPFGRALRRALLYVFLGGALLVFVFPFGWLLSSAFKTKGQIFTLPPRLIPAPIVTDNFSDVFEQTPLIRAFANSVIIAAGHVPLTLLLCCLAGYAFAKYRRAPGRDGLFAVVLGTMMIPGVITMIPVFIVLCRLHLVNSYTAMILPGAANAFGIFWLRQYIAAHVPDDLLAAARIDGCSELAVFWRVVVPVIRPALGALGILVLIGNWNNLMWAFVVLRTEEMYTLPLLIYLLQGELRTPYGMLMAAGLLTTLPLVIAFLFFQRSFIRGMTAGALKG
jgi:ABC-type glycerol-3-phosphate transport system permease component